MKRIHIVLEAIAHDYLIEQAPKNITGYFDEIHPAVTWGLGSRPSCGAYIGGMLPICQIPQCHHRVTQKRWSNPFFMTTMLHETDKPFLLTSNGWTLELLLPWMNFEQQKLNFEWVEMRKDMLPAKDMVEHFLSGSEDLSSYYAYIHLFETHYPFHAPGLPRNGEHRAEALEYVDKQIGRIFDERDDADIVLTSDHNLPPHIVSAAEDVPAPKTMLSFIATNFTECEETYEGDHLEYARRIYLR